MWQLVFEVKSTGLMPKGTGLKKQYRMKVNSALEDYKLEFQNIETMRNWLNLPIFGFGR